MGCETDDPRLRIRAGISVTFSIHVSPRCGPRPAVGGESSVTLRTAVMLAAGSGKRMRRADSSAPLTPEQRAMADSGLKTLMPFERSFLEYSLAALADTGFRRICLVVSPHQAELIHFCRGLRNPRFELELAYQTEPKGTADAVLAAESRVASESQFAVLNGDNYYSVGALSSLRALTGPGLVAFDRAGLLARREVNFDRERIARFAIVQTDSEDALLRILEKPDRATYDELPEPVLVSMNCWRFSPDIFRDCEAIPESERGELEITAAVQHSIDTRAASYEVATSTAPILALSERADISAVARFLGRLEVNL